MAAMSETGHSPSSDSLSEGGHYVRDLNTVPPGTHCQRRDTMSETEHRPSSDSLSGEGQGGAMSETEHSPSSDSLSEGGHYVRD